MHHLDQSLRLTSVDACGNVHYERDFDISKNHANRSIIARWLRGPNCGYDAVLASIKVVIGEVPVTKMIFTCQWWSNTSLEWLFRCLPQARSTEHLQLRCRHGAADHTPQDDNIAHFIEKFPRLTSLHLEDLSHDTDWTFLRSKAVLKLRLLHITGSQMREPVYVLIGSAVEAELLRYLFDETAEQTRIVRIDHSWIFATTFAEHVVQVSFNT